MCACGNPETARSTGLAILFEPYLSHERLGDTSGEGPERAVPSEAGAIAVKVLYSHVIFSARC